MVYQVYGLFKISSRGSYISINGGKWSTMSPRKCKRGGHVCDKVVSKFKVVALGLHGAILNSKGINTGCRGSIY